MNKTTNATFKKHLLLNFIIDPNKLLYFPWYPDAFFHSVAYNLLAPFLKKLAPKKGLYGLLWPSSKIFGLKHWHVKVNLQFLVRLKEETTALMKDRDRIQYKLERNVIYQQYLEKVLESAEEVRLQ